MRINNIHAIYVVYTFQLRGQHCITYTLRVYYRIALLLLVFTFPVHSLYGGYIIQKKFTT